MTPIARIARVFVLFSALVGATAFAGAKQEQVPSIAAADVGVLVVRVEPQSPAASAGIVRGDIIVSVDGTDVATGAEIRGAVTARKPGDTVKVALRHGDETRVFSVKLGELSGQAYLGVYFESGPTIVPVPRMKPGPDNGPRILTVTGAQVTKVITGSPAEKAGIAVGAVITAVDGTTFTRGEDLASIISTHTPGDTITLGVLEAQADSREVEVTLGENPQDTAKPWIGIEYRMAVRVEGSTPWAGRLDIAFGVRIAGVIEDSPAAKAGIAKGDLLTSVDGKDVRLAQQVGDAVHEHQPGDTIEVGVVKGGGRDVTKISLTLGENPEEKGAAFLGVQLSAPWLAPGFPGPEHRKKIPGGIDA